MTPKERAARAKLIDQVTRAVEEKVKEEATMAMVAVARAVVTNEAEILDEELSRLHISVADREQIFEKINRRRLVTEIQIMHPGAFDRYLAVAQVLGLLPEIALTSPKEAHHG